ncbi:MAG: C25 family cysteine peptidase [Candidatus Limimorpha sp.]
MKYIICLIIILLASFCATSQAIEQIYDFSSYHDKGVKSYVRSVERGYSVVDVEGCMQSALAGEPSLPWHSVALLLPMGTEAESIEVEMSDFKSIAEGIKLFPYQPCRRLSDTQHYDFLIDETSYSSKEIYPASNHGTLTTQYVNGFPVAISSFSPVCYVPSEGRVMIAGKVMVRVKVHDNGRDALPISVRQENINKVLSLVQNPEMLDSYNVKDKGLVSRYLDGYELLVVTGSDYVEKFDEYRSFYSNRNIRTRVISLDSIYSSMQGVDNQDKIRNFIIREYTDNDIMMVLLGGDVAIVPYRGFYCDVVSGGSHVTSNNIPADLYYAALDGSWDDDGDGVWGEIGEDDLLPEIGVARMPFNNDTQLEHLINKAMMYQLAPVEGEFHTVVLGGEKLHDNPYTLGSQYLELLVGTHGDNGYTTVGIDEDYDFVRLYHENGDWSGQNLRNAINSGVGYVHHSGHANSDYVAGWYGGTMTASAFAGADGKGHNYTFFHTHGCDCGAFDSNSILEKMTTIETFAVCAIGNSRYGWFNEGQTEGPSCHLQREMTNAFWAERIPFIGLAMTQGKCSTAPWVTAPGQHEEGALRWNFYDLNILGDVAVSPWHDEPFNAKVNYEPALLLGTTSTEVSVSHQGQPLKNFRCAVYNSDNVKLGESVTDDGGHAVIEFVEPVSEVGQLFLYVTGMNSFLRYVVIDAIDENTAFVKPINMLANDEDGDGIVEFGESVSFDLVLRNWGMAATDNIQAIVQCCSPTFFKFLKIQGDMDHIDGMAVDTIFDAFELVLNHNVPDSWGLSLNVTVNDGVGYWYNSFYYPVAAPDVEILSMSCVEASGNGNGVVEAGESAALTVKMKNNGGTEANSVSLNISCDSQYITMDNNSVLLPIIAAGEEVEIETTIHVAENAPNSTIVNFTSDVMCGEYSNNFLFTMTIGFLVDGFETGDFSKLQWEMEGDAPWIVTDEDSYEGDFSARSGAIDDDEITSLVITADVYQDGEISFFFKTSTEIRRDYFAFFIDDVMQDWWSGENDWQMISYTISAGIHKLEWRYDKSPNGSAGLDAAYIDNVSFPLNTVIILSENGLAAEDGILIFPNPNNGSFYVKAQREHNEVVVYDVMGNTLYRNNDAQALQKIDVQGLTSGMYFVRINNIVERIIVTQ